jgi:hypothetical protein
MVQLGAYGLIDVSNAAMTVVMYSSRHRNGPVKASTEDMTKPLTGTLNHAIGLLAGTGHGRAMLHRSRPCQGRPTRKLNDSFGLSCKDHERQLLKFMDVG